MSTSPGMAWYAAGGLLAVLAICAAAYFVGRSADDVLGDASSPILVPGTSDESVEYTLRGGSSAGDVGRQLEDLGIIRSGRQFALLVGLMGVHDRLQADTYTFRKGLAAATVIQRMIDREVVPVLRVTFPEGIRIEEMAQIAERAGFGTAQAFLDAAAKTPVPPEFLPGAPGTQPLQGLLFPDTYILPVGSSSDALVKLMLKTLQERFTAEMRRAGQERSLSPYQVVNLAAIVEREAVLEEERPIIASVFLNRLKVGVKLDADPTVQFTVALDPQSVSQFGYWKKDLTLEDLKVASPYNTYLNAGLPPGAIANPGLASIKAVVSPANTKYEYFVADTIKADGSHAFAETLDEHLANVARFQR